MVDGVSGGDQQWIGCGCGVGCDLFHIGVTERSSVAYGKVSDLTFT